MRNLFIVGAKLLGIYLLVIHVFSHVYYIMETVLRGGENSFPILLSFIVILCSYLAAFYVLVFRTEGLAKFMNIPDNEFPLRLPMEYILQVGLIFIGVYVLINSLPSLLTQISFQYQQFIVNSRFNYSSIVIPTIKVILSLILMFASKKVSGWILENQFTGQVPKPQPVKEDV